MPQKLIPIGEWLPDLPRFFNPGQLTALNCIPSTQLSYSPLQDLKPIGNSGIVGPALGMFAFLDKGMGQHIFVGDPKHLYHLFTHDGSFFDASNPLETYNTSPDNPWRFTSFAEAIIATNGLERPQILVIGDDQFTSMDIPRAKFIATVRDFLVLGFVTETDGVTYSQRIHWSALGNAALFPPLGSREAAETLSDAQDLRSDLGLVQGLAANLQSADFAVFMDHAVYRGEFVGSPATFSLTVTQGATGTRSPNSIVSSRGYAYYLSQSGFTAFDGTSPKKIGAEKVDHFFFTDPNDGVELGFLTLVQGAADPTSKLVMWAYASRGSTTGAPNRLLIYNWSLERWSFARLTAQWISSAASVGYTLEELDVFGNLETIGLSLDSQAWMGGTPGLYAVDLNGNLSTFGGGALEAIIELPEMQPAPGQRSRVLNVRPLVDGSSPSISLGMRNRQEDAVVYTNPSQMNWHGNCPQRADARYFSAKVVIPAQSIWTHCQGVELDFAPSTRR